MNNYPKIFLYSRLVHSKLFIDKHYSEKIDLNDISEEAYCSKYHFIRLFKKIYNRTPHQYLSFVRLEHAKIMLKTDTSIVDICFEIGFENSPSFTSLFKKTYGKTPSEYKREQLRLLKEKKEIPLKFIPECITEKFYLDSISQFPISQDKEKY
jgi:AraC-type DNA-binding domain-containing proteins